MIVNLIKISIILIREEYKEESNLSEISQTWVSNKKGIVTLFKMHMSFIVFNNNLEHLNLHHFSKLCNKKGKEP